MGILMLITTCQLCISSIRDQPQIIYRFIAMLYCFVQSLVTILSTTYFFIDSTNTKHKHSVALLIRLCTVVSHLFGVMCCYAFLSTIINSLYRARVNQKNPPTYIIIAIRVFCASVPFLDILLTGSAFIFNDAHFQYVFMFILQIWIFLFCILSYCALFGAAKQFKTLLNRAQSAHAVNMSETLSVHLLDFNDNESAYSTHVDRQRYKIFQRQLYKMYFLILLDCMSFIFVAVSIKYLLKMLYEGNGHQELTQSPMASIGSYLIGTVIFVLSLVALVYWLYVPFIAKDSLFYYCCSGVVKINEHKLSSLSGQGMITDSSPMSTRSTTDFELLAQQQIGDVTPLMSYLSIKRPISPMMMELAPILEPNDDHTNNEEAI